MIEESAGAVPSGMSWPTLARAALPVAAVGVFATFVLAALLASAAAGTLGFDFLAYHLAAGRLLDGEPVYDMSFVGAGSFGLFYYPPTFILFVLPFALLPAVAATWLWTVVLVAAFLLGVALLPVSTRVKWVIVLLAGLDWPFLYAMKLGQVGPLLFLAFAAGWRWLDRPLAVGMTAAIGAAIKIQPGLVLAWALALRRWRTVILGGVALLVLAGTATVLSGVDAWADYRTLLARVTDPITTEHNLTPGAIAFQWGVGPDAAFAIQVAGWAFAVVAILVGAWKATPVAGYLVTVAASQLISPILWDHYAMLLLLPVAWLLDRGVRWVVIVPLATSVIFVESIPAAIYPIMFAATILVTLWIGRRTAAHT